MDESGHWYDKHGNLVRDLPYADKKRVGELRQPTLRDARKLDLLPSVTTIISILDRPGLRAWKLGWAIDIAIAMPNADREAVLLESEAFVEAAAAAGSKIHLGLHEHFEGRATVIEPETDEIVREFWPWYLRSGLELVHTEHPIVAPQGWAGTVDYIGTYYGEPAIVDFKTQDFETEKAALFYDEHPLQLSGYAIGAGLQDHRRLSVILSRSVPGLVAIRDWSSESPRWDAAWWALWELWQHVKNYYPGRVYDVNNVKD